MSIPASRTSDYREKLTTSIRGKIEKYNIKSLLKEFLQNADDAGATQLQVTLDLRTHESFGDESFNIATGPALIISNDAPLTDKDAVAIGKLMDGHKVDSAHSTGRFGQGFTSSFSVSDHPSLFSGGIDDGMSMWFDVHHSHVCKDEADPVITWLHRHIREDHPEHYPTLTKWLNTFLLPDEDDVKGGTVFRLPLRTQDTAKFSAITSQIFTLEHFDNWCDEWKKHPENLLFLRNINSLTMFVVDSAGTKHDRLQIKTKNVDVVSSVKKDLNSAFSKDVSPEEGCKAWMKNDRELPFIKYEQEFHCKYYDRQTSKIVSYDSKWAIANGLFRGEDNVLLKQALKVLGIEPNNRKVLPWAGVAIPLSKMEFKESEKGRFFTFLPLEIPTDSNVHLHGWFELDDKRSEIILKEGNDDQALLIEWNLLLAEYAIGKAWAEILLAHKNTLSIETYYKYWPSYVSSGDELTSRLQKGFYEHMAQAECLNVRYKNKEFWAKPSLDLFYCCKQCNADAPSLELKNIVQKQIKLMYPEPPKSIIAKLEAHGAKTSVFSPDILIEHVSSASQDMTFPAEENNLSALFFADKKNICHVLKYAVCGTLGKIGVEGLPLQYCLDGKLHKIESLTVFSDNYDAAALRDDKARFVERKWYQGLERDETPNTWLNANLANYLKVAAEMMKYESMNLDWLDNIIELARRSGEAQLRTKQAKTLFASLPIFKGASSDLFSLDSIGFAQKVPYLELISDDRSRYEALQIPLYDKNWLTRYQKLDKLFGEGFSPFSKVTDEVVLAHVASMDLDTQQSLRVTNFRHFVLRTIKSANLSNTNNVSALKNIKENIPLALTQSGTLATISNSQRKLFLPGGFTVDDSLGHIKDRYDLIHSEEEEFYPVFESLDVDRMSFSKFVKSFVIVWLSKSNNYKAKHQVLKWLCDQIDLVRQNREVIEALSVATIVPTSDRLTVKPSEVYTPTFFKSLPLALSATAIKFSDFQHESWNELLELCGAQTEVSDESVINAAIYIAKKKHIGEAFELIKFLHSSLLEKKTPFNQKVIQSRLKEISWIPCIGGEDVVAGRLNSKPKLSYADSIVTRSLTYKLCPSFNLLAPQLETGIKKEKNSNRASLSPLYTFLGVRTSSTLELETQNFNSLVGEDISGKNKSFLQQMSETLYASWGVEAAKDVKTKLSTVFISERWVPISKTFFCRVGSLPGFYSVEGFLNQLNTDSNKANIKSGLKKLGVLAAPSKQSLIDYLHHNLGLNKELTEREVEIAKSVLALLERDHLDSISKGSSLPLLATDNKLYLSSNVFIDEGRELEAASSRNLHLRICASEFHTLAKKTDAKSIKYNSVKSIKGNETKITPKGNIPADITKYIEKLKTAWFENAVRRLAFHSLDTTESDAIQTCSDRVIPDNIILCDSLTLSCDLNIWLYDTNKRKVFNDAGEFYVVKDSALNFCSGLANYISEELSFNTSSGVLIFALISQIDGQDDAVRYLEDNGVSELPEMSKYKPLQDFHIEQPIEDDLEHEPSQIPADNKPRKPNTSQVTSGVGEVKGSTIKVSHNEKENIRDKLDREHYVDAERIRKLEARNNSTRAENQETQHIISTEPNTDQSAVCNEETVKELTMSKLGDKSLNAPWHILNGTQVTRTANKRLNVSHDSYISHNRKSGVGNYFSDNQATLIGNSGEYAVLEAIKKTLVAGHEIQKASTNNPGYDLKELDSHGNIVRKIEVKTLPGGWGDRGVTLSKTQVRLALTDHTWSLVVVVGHNTGKASFIDLGNPFESVNSYFLPSEWNRNTPISKVEILPFER
ncbi:hypothetical protein C0Z01_20265 [Photobacterium kishitanii]|uniref:sacsin N-terminal ATP-binding-like domain-containing protein n=1 Tax=Photobacterium kishitanii TaxID=318456 RepID=UPI000D177E1B|nr:hypothetical protein [Photobacterium kishitanii]PSW66553.1 hypothetical protein C0Z01_20265 [Photobacterium kishitanii]